MSRESCPVMGRKAQHHAVRLEKRGKFSTFQTCLPRSEKRAGEMSCGLCATICLPFTLVAFAFSPTAAATPAAAAGQLQRRLCWPRVGRLLRRAHGRGLASYRAAVAGATVIGRLNGRLAYCAVAGSARLLRGGHRRLIGRVDAVFACHGHAADADSERNARQYRKPLHRSFLRCCSRAPLETPPRKRFKRFLGGFWASR
jgi:hypothetical protein